MSVTFPVSDIEVTLPNGELATVLDGELELDTYSEAADPSVGAPAYIVAWATEGWIEVVTEILQHPIHIVLRAGHPVLEDLNKRYGDEMSEAASDSEW